MGGSGGATITGSASISSGNSWHIVGAADFNADGHPDLVWQNPTNPNAGAAQIWYMGGTNGATFLSAADVSSGNSWRIVTAAKYPITISGSASNAYLVWEDPVAGAVQFWYESTSQSSPQLLSAVTVSASTPWRVVADADFNGDGIPDAVWQNPSTGAVEIWLMGGSQGATLHEHRAGDGSQYVARRSGCRFQRQRHRRPAVGEHLQRCAPDLVHDPAVAGASA